MAQTDYVLVIRSPEGVRRAQLTGTRGGFTALSASMRVNSAGLLSFRAQADHPAIAYLEDDAQIELWRNSTLLFSTLYQGPAQYTVDDQDQEYFIGTCYGVNDLLNRAVIAWPADTINRTSFENMAAESIMHILVEYNCTAQATEANGRLVTFADPRIVVEDDLGRGTQISRTDLVGKPLLTALQEIAEMGHVDFDLIQTASRQWTFRVFDGQRGTDRSATVVFSRSRRNMAQLVTNAEMQDPRSVIIIGGQGQVEDREFAVRYGPDYASTYHREHFESYSGDSFSTASLQAEGDRIAQERRIHSTFTFVPLQVSGTRYNVDYELGDLVGGVYRDMTATFKVVGVSIGLEPATTEQIVVEIVQQ
jgi:hypothetical protein